MTKNTIPNIWTAQERLLHIYKLLTFAISIIALVLVIVLIAQGYQNPIVVLKSGEIQEFYPAERKIAPIGKNEVEEFTKKFLVSLYVWNEFNAQKLAKEIGPFTDEDLIPKFVEAQNKRYVRDLNGKKLEQAITFLKVDIQPDRVNCTFDRILKIAGIPLVIPTSVTLWMTQRDPTRVNPVGIYVTSITESDGAK